MGSAMMILLREEDENVGEARSWAHVRQKERGWGKVETETAR